MLDLKRALMAYLERTLEDGMDNDLDTARFSISDMTRTTGVDAGTIRSWFQRGHLTMGLTDKVAPTNGMARLFSARTVLLVGIVGALTKLGIHPRTAAAAATEFCDDDASTAGYPGRARGLERDPGMLFPLPAEDTLIVIYPGGTQPTRIIPQTDDASTFRTIMGGLPHPGVEGFTCLALFSLVNQIRAGLGLSRDNGELLDG